MVLPVILTAALFLSPSVEAVQGSSKSTRAAEESQLIEVEKQKTLPHEPAEFLATTIYKPSKLEEPHSKAITPVNPANANTSPNNVIVGQVGQQVAWFGIVRDDKWVKGSKDTHHELLVEHKYFDGLTDTHQQIVSFSGDGDFKAILPFEKKLPFKTLCLVRCYGEVVSEKDGVPTLQVKFIRVWPWNNFAFMSLDNLKLPDRTNKRWRKGIDLPEKVYSPTPDTDYYQDLLGKQK